MVKSLSIIGLISICFFACNIYAKKIKDSQNIDLLRKEIQEQIVKKYDIEKAVQNLVNTGWAMHSDSGYITKYFTELQKYLKKNNPHSFYAALKFKSDCEVELYAQILILDKNSEYGSSFTKKYEYRKDQKHPGLLHFLDIETGKEDFSLQIVSPYLMVDTQHSQGAHDKETLLINLSLLKKDQKGTCLEEKALLGKKLVKYDLLEEYLLYKKVKNTHAGYNNSKFNNLFSYMIKKKDQNLISEYIPEFENLTKDNENTNNEDLLSVHCSQAYQVITGTDEGFLTASIIMEGKPSPTIYGNMRYYIYCLDDNQYCYTIHPYGFAVLHTNKKINPNHHNWEDFTEPGIALNFPSTLYVLVD